MMRTIRIAFVVLLFTTCICLLNNCKTKSVVMQTNEVSNDKRKADAMTVLKVLPSKAKASFTDIIFMNSQRVFKLPNSKDATYLDLLKESEAKGTAVLIFRTSEYSDTILRVTLVPRK